VAYGAATPVAGESPPQTSAAVLPQVQSARHSLGPLALGLTESEVLQVLGQPEQLTPEVEEAATGNLVLGWKYPKLGLTLTMARVASTQPLTLLRFTATAPCRFATNRGIRIGSSRAALDAAYAADYARDAAANDSAGGTDQQHAVVDSIYGGVVFAFEHHLVAEIFLGAAAE